MTGYRSGNIAEIDHIELVQIALNLPRLDPEFDGYRLVQISDIHMGTGGMDGERLSQIVEMVNAQEPDVVVITGDFTTHGSVEAVADQLIEPLKHLRPADCALSVLGNHDHVTDPVHVREIARAAKIIDLNNQVHTIYRDDAQLHFGGIDTSYYQKDRLDEVLAHMPDKGAAILLAHEPEFADRSAKTGRFDLQLSGHSHGGQVRLFNLAMLPVPHGMKYRSGQYQIGKMIQYTNRGLGTGTLPLRINCRPEITVLTLRAGTQ
jgi:hypothetical protein